MKWDAYQRACSPAWIVPSGSAKVACLKCDCGKLAEWRLSGRLPPADIIQKHFVNQGWRLERRSAVCPACQQKRKPIMEKQKAPAPQPSDAARKAKQLVFMALMDYYDAGAKAYKPPHSDASIAKECDCAPEFVAKVREADFGPLVVPSEIVALRMELAEATRAHAEVAAVITDISGRLTRVLARNGWAA